MKSIISSRLSYKSLFIYGTILPLVASLCISFLAVHEFSSYCKVLIQLLEQNFGTVIAVFGALFALPCVMFQKILFEDNKSVIEVMSKSGLRYGFVISSKVQIFGIISVLLTGIASGIFLGDERKIFLIVSCVSYIGIELYLMIKNGFIYMEIREDIIKRIEHGSIRKVDQ